MTKYIFAVVLAMLSITAVQAQRMMPGQKGLEVNAGLVSKDIKDNYYLNLTLTAYGKNGNYWIWGAEYTHGLADYRTVQIPLETYTGEVGYALQLLGDARKTFTLNAGLPPLGDTKPLTGARQHYMTVQKSSIKTILSTEPEDVCLWKHIYPTGLCCSYKVVPKYYGVRI